MTDDEVGAGGSDWPPTTPGWDYEEADGVHVFRGGGAHPLVLGDIPDRFTVAVKSPKTRMNRALRIEATSARYVELSLDPAWSSYEFVGRFNQVKIGAADKSGQRPTLKFTTAPTRLFLNDGQYTLQEIDDGSNLTMRVDAATNCVLDVRACDVAVIAGAGGQLAISAASSEIGSIDFAGLVFLRGASQVASLRCEAANIETSLVAKSVVLGEGGLGANGRMGSLKAEEMTSSGPVYASSIECGHLVVEGSSVVASSDHRSAVAAASRLRSDASDGQLGNVDSGLGSIVVGTLDVRGGSVSASSVSVTSGSCVVDGHLVVDRLSVGDDQVVKVGALSAAKVVALSSPVEASEIRVSNEMSARRVSAGRIELLGSVTITERLDAHESLQSGCELDVPESAVGGDCHVTAGSISGRCEVRGNLEVADGGRLDDVNWVPDAPDQGRPTATIDGVVRKLDIRLSGSGKLAGAGIVPEVGPLRIVGALALKPSVRSGTQRQRNDPVDLGEISLGSGASIRLPSDLPTEIRRLDVDGAECSVVVDNQPCTITVGADADFELVVGGPTSLSCGDQADGHAVKLRASGRSPLTLSGHIRVLDCSDATQPLLRLEPTASIAHATGRLRLDKCQGRLTSAWIDDVPPAQLIEVGEGLGGGRSHLLGLDVTELSAPELSNLGQITSVEPDAATLKAFAREEGLSEYEVRQRAQWSVDLKAALTGKVSSGRTSATASWVAARLQHRAIRRDPGHRWELIGRWLHRLVGYGHSVLPPLVSWLAASLALTLVSLDRWSNPAFTIDMCSLPNSIDRPPCVAGLGDFGREFARIALFPFRLLRLSDGELVFFFLPDWFQPLAGLIVGLPFIFLLIALRRYFKLAHDE